jgi:uncharacterized protein YcfJ
MKLLNHSRKLAVASTLATLALAAPAFADHESGLYRTKTASVSGYANGGYANGRSAAQYDYAKVLSAQPIIRYVTISTPVRECRQDVEYYTVDRRARGTGAATLVGAIVGGVVGHQFGSGRGNDAATVAGTLIGAAVGNDSSRRRNGYSQVEYSRPVQRCDTVIREREEERIDGYNVVYRYHGQKYATRMPYDPGRELRIRVDVRPVG